MENGIADSEGNPNDGSGGCFGIITAHTMDNEYSLGRG